MIKATKTLVKREAVRVFGQCDGVTLDNITSFRTCWRCSVFVTSNVFIECHSLTKQGALDDALELLRGLDRRAP